MRMGIVGTGAMGSLFAWQLAEAGAEVLAFDRWQAHVDAIAARGLMVHTAAGKRVVPMGASSDAAPIGPCDALIVFVKHGQTAAAMEAARPMVGPQTLILTLQNGIGNLPLIREAFPEARLAYGLTTLTSEMLGPGEIEASYAGRGETWFAPFDREADETDRTLCALLDGPAARAVIDPGIDLRIWKKLVINCCYNAICGLLDCTVGEARARPGAPELLAATATEVARIARARGIDLPDAEALAYLDAVGRDAATHLPSMAVDLRQGRATEIGALCGAVVREAEAAGIEAPVNATLRDLILARDAAPRAEARAA
ncbi:2-dehydropantoate 2-reductase [Paracoccus sp. S-4012]|uniref:ketopantoate reductase family protein n=1 Tax=Paracoccus sp. S-4012 TaxID=2665648 RepID=UPI0012AF31E1|nr:2-dehydropantoate 2-reductase [Paracoccus sp. S-4012]MRX51956.1 2-dehydropantoate 2-reductase [Paracoccus sp. S-4012]